MGLLVAVVVYDARASLPVATSAVSLAESSDALANSVDLGLSPPRLTRLPYAFLHSSVLVLHRAERSTQGLLADHV